MKKITLILIFQTYSFVFVFAQITSREYFKVAKGKFDAGEYDKCIEFSSKAIESDSKYANAYFLRAEAYYIKEMYPNSISDINNAMNQQQDTAAFQSKYLAIRAISYDQLSKTDLATADAKLAKERGSDDPEVGYYIAQFYINRNNYADALKEINQTLSLNDGNGDFYVKRAEIKFHEKYNNWSDADIASIISDYARAISLNPTNTSYLIKRSNFYRSINNYEQAITDYNKVITLKPENDEAITERGVMMLHSKNYQDAIVDFSKSIQLNPKNEDNYNYRALCLHNMNAYDRAYRDFSEAINLLKERVDITGDNKSLDLKLAEAYMMRGNTLMSMGKKSEACEDFYKSYQLGFNRANKYYRKNCVAGFNNYF